MLLSFDFATLRSAYRERATKPVAVAEDVLARIARAGNDAVWINRVSDNELRRAAAMLERRRPEGLPLYGLPFAVKDNIDAAGLPTTCACPGFSHLPERSAPAVERLVAAGALLVGKTNLDQFATGLVGTRSPYGACRNSFNPADISGGSSSGSAVAVALGLASFSEYCRVLDGPDGDAERRVLVNAITTNHTSFFREPHHFEYMTKTLLPAILQKGSEHNQRLRIDLIVERNRGQETEGRFRHIGGGQRRFGLIPARAVIIVVIGRDSGLSGSDERTRCHENRHADGGRS